MSISGTVQAARFRWTWRRPRGSARPRDTKCARAKPLELVIDADTGTAKSIRLLWLAPSTLSRSTTLFMAFNAWNLAGEGADSPALTRAATFALVFARSRTVPRPVVFPRWRRCRALLATPERFGRPIKPSSPAMHPPRQAILARSRRAGRRGAYERPRGPRGYFQIIRIRERLRDLWL